MTEPPLYLQAVLHSIELVVKELYSEFKSLNDKDVEWVFQQLQLYYKQLAVGKSMEEPLSSLEKRQALIDEILNILEEREEIGADLDCINHPDCAPGGKLITSLAALYAMGFKRLQQSVRFWRKKEGAKGYLSFISSQPF